MNYRFIFVLLITSFSFGQNNDYNAKKGVMIEGYDVVSYFDEKPSKGSDEFTLQYDGVIFKFSSLNNLVVFRKNPEKYLPKYGGYCAYAIAKNGDKVRVNPETYTIIDGELYLFYNSWANNTLKLWNKSNDVKGLIYKGDQNWEASKKKN